MPARKLHWTRRFYARYKALHREAFASLKTGKEKPMRRLIRVGETLETLRGASIPLEGDPRLDTRSYMKLSRLAHADRTVYGSRIRRAPADYRIFWQHSSENAEGIELVDLVWPCL
jgi:hypothetical protein